MQRSRILPVLSVLVYGGLCGSVPLSGQSAALTEADEYVRYDLSAPATSTFRVTYEVSATTEGATRYVEPIAPGTVVTQFVATDLMTGDPLTVSKSTAALTIALARPVPKNGLGRIRLERTVKDARGYTLAGGAGVFRQTLRSRRGRLVLPAGFELLSCNMPSQVLSENDGRISIAFMNQAPGTATLEVRLRAGAATGPAAAPRPLTTARSWEPPPAQGATERTRLGERAAQDRDITYFLLDPSTNAFSLFHDYTESRPGTDKYINVVRTGSRVSNPSASILDTGEVLRHETLKGQAITDAKIDIGSAVTPETEIVVSYFPAVQAGKSVRLRIAETYTAPQSYRLDGEDLVFDRSLGRPRNSVVLPAGWYLTASSIPAVISETADKRIRLDFYNGRNDSIDVLIKARKRPIEARKRPQAAVAYEVYAVKFASTPFGVANLVAGADKDRTIDIAFTVWVAKGGGRTVLVDAGFYRDKFIQQWKPQNYVRPSVALTAGLGIRPDDVTDIIVTHSHWDHLDGADLFPKARVHIQRAEYEYYIGPNGEVLNRGGVDADDATMMAGLKAAGRVNLVDGDAKEVLPGITVYTGGKHTFASQFAGVLTRRGVVVLASDNAYLYENLEKRLAIAQTLDAASNLAAQSRMLTLAALPALVVPGHDPAVFERFPSAGKGVARIDR